MGINRTIQLRITPAKPEIGFSPKWRDFPKGIMTGIMQGMVEARFIDIDGTIWEYRWKPVNGSNSTQEKDPPTGP